MSTQTLLDASEETLHVMVGRRVSIAMINTPYGEFLGEAKRAPGDTWNYAVGYNLAVGRALEEYGAFLQEAADIRSGYLCRQQP